MSSRQELEQAIVALEAQRVALGDDVVEMAVAVLREKLGAPQRQPAVAQHEQLTVLVADLSGFTALSEWRDAEEVRDTINAVWQKLDGVVESWGGKIDKHVGDSVIALFGVPVAGEDDIEFVVAERAIQAALDMHMELSLFNQQTAPTTNSMPTNSMPTNSMPTNSMLSRARSGSPALPAELRMRIGIHTGPVLFGKVGASGEVTAVGDTVNTANQLERLAPVGGILISHAVYRHVHALFDVQPLEFNLLDGAQDSGPFYVVIGDRPGAFRFAVPGVQAVADVPSVDGTSATRLVGRTEELQQLQEALQTAIDSSVVQVVTIIGEAGVGKSRLLYEFEKLLALLPERVCLFKGRGRCSIDRCSIGHQEISPSPYALWHDVFANYFNIHRRHSAAVAREKLVRGVMDVLGNRELGNQRLGTPSAGSGQALRLGNLRLGTPSAGSGQALRLGNLRLHEEASRARERAHFIGHLLGFNFAHSPYLQGIQDDARRIREYAFQDIAHFFQAVSADCPAAVLFLEDIHRADEGSFDLIDYLAQACRHVPLLIVCLARPALEVGQRNVGQPFEKRPSWPLVESQATATYQRLELPPLSAIDSRHLVADILHQVGNIPLKLSDLIVNGAGGNPFTVEEFVKMLIEEGVIVISPERWRVDMARLADVQAPPTLAALLQSRLSRLAPAEQAVLEKAAVVGRVFWDTLLAEGEEGEEVSPGQLKGILHRLEEKEWINQRQLTTFAGTHEYVFRHDTLSEAVYDSVPFSRRQQYHTQAAAWFIAHHSQNASSPVGYANIIARHFERAEEYAQAATWYGRAARQAEIGDAPETAIHYYRLALTLLPAKEGEEAAAAQRVALNEGLGEMLRWRARLSEAVDAFKAMRVAASAIEDYAAEVRALLGVFWAYTGQGEHGAALASASQAESVARAVHSHHALATALAAKGWALLSLGDMNAAVQAGKESLSVSTAAVAPREMAYSNMLLGNIGRVSGYYDQAVQHTEKALHLFRELGDRLWEGLALAQLGRIAWSRDQDATAIARYRESLRIARGIGDTYGIMLSLRQLGRLAQRQDDYARAEEQVQQALLFAEKSGNSEYRTALANDLGELHLAQALAVQSVVDAVKEDHLQQAYKWFRRAWQLAHEADRPLRVAAAQMGLARLYLEDEQWDEAQRHVQEAIAQAERALQAGQGVAAKKALAAAWRVAELVRNTEIHGGNRDS